jgi:hypothetical protein
MKQLKIFAFLIIFIAFFFLSALGKIAAAEPTGYDYYPLKQGDKWTYEVWQVDGKGKKFTQEVSIPGTDKYDDKEYVILKQKDTRGTIRSFCLKDATGVYWKKIGASKSYTPEVSSIFNPAIPILIFPLKAGSIWDWEGTLKIAFMNKKIKMHCEVVGEEEIEVPAGKFKCLKIHIHQQRNEEISDEYGWYAPGVGQIKYIGKELGKQLVSYSVNP